MLTTKVGEELGITVAEAVESSAGVPVSATGQLQINEDASWTVGAITDGKIMSVPARVGDPSGEGQVLPSCTVTKCMMPARHTVRRWQRSPERKCWRNRRARYATVLSGCLNLRAASREQLDAAETMYQERNQQPWRQCRQMSIRRSFT